MRLRIRPIHQVLVASSLLWLILALSACSEGGDPAPLTESEKVTQVMTKGTWKAKTVMVDGVNETSVYAGLELTFTPTSYTSKNGGSVWPASGTWRFTDETGTTIERSDGTVIGVLEATDSQLVLALTWDKTTLEPGRAESIEGQHVVTLG
jgi:hypothetical protein